MKNKKKSLKPEKPVKKENYLRYLISGIAVAAVLLIVLKSIQSDNPSVTGNPKSDSVNATEHEWSEEMDSLFVKNCYEKYKPQVRDDLQKQENMKAFCRCMLRKIKTKYEETEINRVADKDIQMWDMECREEMLNPNKIKVK